MATSRLDDAVIADVDEVTDAQSAGGCSACPHPVATHDAIAARFCAATLQMALDRRCVCPDEVVGTGLGGR
jgi:hypothetical protein